MKGIELLIGQVKPSGMKTSDPFTLCLCFCLTATGTADVTVRVPIAELRPGMLPPLVAGWWRGLNVHHRPPGIALRVRRCAAAVIGDIVNRIDGG